MSSNVIEVSSTTINYIEVGGTSVLVEQPIQSFIEVVTEGPQGPPGDAVQGDLFLKKDNRLSEFAADSAAQLEAQSNLGLGVSDPLAYYILAKA